MALVNNFPSISPHSIGSANNYTIILNNDCVSANDLNGYDINYTYAEAPSLIHERPNMFLNATIQRTSPTNLKCTFNNIYIPPKYPNKSTSDGHDGPWNYKFKYKLAIFVNDFNKGEIYTLDGISTKDSINGEGDVHPCVIDGAARGTKFRFDIGKTINISIGTGPCDVKLALKCTAMYSSGGCNLGDEKDLSGSGIDNLDWYVIKRQAYTIADPYVAPSNAAIQVLSTTTKSITIRCSWSCNDSYYTTTGYVNVLGKQYTIANNGTMTIDNLTTNTSYGITLYASDGRTQSVSSISAKTKLLGLQCTNKIQHQNSLEFEFKSTVDGVINNQGGLSKFYSYSADVGELSPELNQSSISDQTIILSKLESYTEYSVSYTITDGHNLVMLKVTNKTLFPLVRINNGSWQKAIPYIYTNGSWHKAKCSVNSGGWHEVNAE